MQALRQLFKELLDLSGKRTVRELPVTSTDNKTLKLLWEPYCLGTEIGEFIGHQHMLAANVPGFEVFVLRAIGVGVTRRLLAEFVLPRGTVNVVTAAAFCDRWIFRLGLLQRYWSRRQYSANVNRSETRII